MTLHFLTEDQYLEYLEPIDDNQQNQTVHAARLHTGEPGEQIFICKAMPPSSFELGNEVIGHILAHHTCVPSTTTAAILTLPMALARRMISRTIPSGYANADGEVVLWCTKRLPFKSLKSTFRASHTRTTAAIRMICSEGGKRLAAFDHLTGYADRHDGNYLWIGPGECVAIDHEMLFGYEDWRAGSALDFQTRNELLEQLRRAVLGGVAKQHALDELTSGMVFYGEEHAAAVESAGPEIKTILGHLYGESPVANVLTCLALRSTSNWMKKELGLI